MVYIQELHRHNMHTMQLYAVHFRETYSKSYWTEKEYLRYFKFKTIEHRNESKWNLTCICLPLVHKHQIIITNWMVS